MTANVTTAINSIVSPLPHLDAALPDERVARRLALQANLQPFTKKLSALVRTFGRKPPALDVARVVVIECLEAGYTTQEWIARVSDGLPLKTSDVAWVLWNEKGPDRLWDWNDDEKYSLNPSV